MMKQSFELKRFISLTMLRKVLRKGSSSVENSGKLASLEVLGLFTYMDVLGLR